MKRVFLIEYAIILFMNINARLNPKLVAYPQKVLYLFNAFYIAILMIELLLSNILKAKWVVKRTAHFGVFFVLIFLIYLFSIFNSNSSVEQSLLSIMLLVMVFITAKMINRLNCLKDYVCLSFVETTVIFIIICLKHRVNMMSALITNIAYLTGIHSARVRVDFTFYNVNAAANLLICILSISCIVYHLIYKGFHKLLYWISVFFLLLLLLSTGSRTAAFSVCLCVILLVMGKIMQFKFLESEQRSLAALFILLRGIVFSYFMHLDIIFSKYVVSRGRTYDNINLLQSIKSKLTGYGLVAPGRFIDIKMRGVKGFYLDNFYVYIYVTMGMVGLIIMVSFFIYIGLTLIKYSRIHNEYFRILICFIVCIVSGFTETGVFYYLFPSSFMYFSIFISCLYKKDIKLAGEIYDWQNKKCSKKYMGRNI